MMPEVNWRKSSEVLLARELLLTLYFVAGLGSACVSQPEAADVTKRAEETWSKIETVFSKSSIE
jgi:hypothetical protein